MLYITAKQQEARLNARENENIDVKVPHAMFGDNDINFDLQLQKWEVDSDALKETEVWHVFFAWIED